MKTCVFTPTHETGILMADIIPYAGSHDTRLGRESSWPLAPAGTPCFFRPLRVKGLFRALADRAAFLFRRNPLECAKIWTRIGAALPNKSGQGSRWRVGKKAFTI